MMYVFISMIFNIHRYIFLSHQALSDRHFLQHRNNRGILQGSNLWHAEGSHSSSLTKISLLCCITYFIFYFLVILIDWIKAKFFIITTWPLPQLKNISVYPLFLMHKIWFPAKFLIDCLYSHTYRNITKYSLKKEKTHIVSIILEISH